VILIKQKNVATALGLMVLIAGSNFALADDIPGDCLASFNVKDGMVSADLNWTLGSNTSGSMSCAAGELLREKLFVDGESMLTEGDLSGSPSDAQQQAIAAYDDMVQKIQQLPGDDTAGTIFAAGAYLVAKYKWASCILTAELEGGTCWAATASFIGGTTKFFLKISQNQTDSLRKQDLLTQLQKLRPAISSPTPGKSDPGGARSRWVQSQTLMCRAIQQQCL
jgi:hypothetical protein